MAENLLSCRLGHKKNHSQDGSKELRATGSLSVSGARWMANEFHFYKARLAKRPDSAFKAMG